MVIQQIPKMAVLKNGRLPRDPTLLRFCLLYGPNRDHPTML
jgi:hypothetical protein